MNLLPKTLISIELAIYKLTTEPTLSNSSIILYTPLGSNKCSIQAVPEIHHLHIILQCKTRCQHHSIKRCTNK